MKNALLVLLAALYVTNAGAADQAEHKVTTDQGRMLVLASLTPQQKRLPSIEANPYGNSNSKFLFYTVTWAGTQNGSVVVGNYAVDPQTGDVFSATMECYEEKNRNLTALQKRVRAALHLTEAEYQKFKSKGPLCEE